VQPTAHHKGRPVARIRRCRTFQRLRKQSFLSLPDLAITTYGENIKVAKRAAAEAIRINLESCREAGQGVPDEQAVSHHLENPEFRDLLFAYVEVPTPKGKIAE
jgi:hypothetical protein